jgi:23S rRNA pseudouridine1911/1915/1917 synthase
MPETEIEIVAEEPHFLLVNKPAGLFTQAAPGVPSLELLLAQQLKARDQHPGNPFVGLPHRLDRATSGIMLIARNRRALAKFGEQFHSRKINKFYLAVLEGELPPATQLWEDFVRKIPDCPKAEIVPADAEHAKRAEMRIKAIASRSGRTLALVQLLTGRMHQIRIQAAHRGYPLVDDALYGNGILPTVKSEGELDAIREQPHALHALRLEFRHPQTAKAMVATAMPPGYWEGYSTQLESSSAAIALKSQRATDSWNGLSEDYLSPPSVNGHATEPV